MEQSKKSIESCQAICTQGLTRAGDAQFELLDALLLSLPIRSFPELSLSPAFRRQWTGAKPPSRRENKTKPGWDAT